MAVVLNGWWGEVLASTAMSAALLALVGTIFKDWIAARLKGVIEHRYAVALAAFQSELRTRADQDVERVRAELKRENDVELEKLKANLAAQSAIELVELKNRLERTANREQHAFAQLHDRRVDALAELHAHAFRMQNIASRVLVLNPSKQQLTDMDDFRAEVVTAVQATIEFLTKNGLYLPLPLIKQFETYRVHYMDFVAAIDNVRAMVSQTGYSLEATQALNRATKMVMEELRVAVTVVETSMRKLLGDTGA
jgi:hypothetical protein